MSSSHFSPVRRYTESLTALYLYKTLFGAFNDDLIVAAAVGDVGFALSREYPNKPPAGGGNSIDTLDEAHEKKNIRRTHSPSHLLV